MSTKCQDTQTIYLNNIMIMCGHNVYIGNFSNAPQSLDIVIDNVIYTSYGSTQGRTNIKGDEVWTLSHDQYTIDQTNGSVKLNFIISDNPCYGITCSNICIGNDLYAQKCNILYETDTDKPKIPIGYNCIQDYIIEENSSNCSHLECISGTCTRVTGAGTNACTTEGSTTECATTEYTHILEIRIRPWGWYTPNGAASDLIKKISDIDGWCTNLATSLTGWEYIETIIVPDGEDVLIQTKFKNYSTLTSSINSLLPAAVVAFIEKIALMISAIIIITIAIGIMTGWKFFEVNSDPTTSPTYEPQPKDIEPKIEGVINDQTDTCLTVLPPTPTCADVTSYATCLKAAHIGVYGTLTAVKPNFQKFQDTYNKYLDIYTNLTATCDEGTVGKTPSDILNGIITIQQEYTEDLKDNFDELQKVYDSEQCWIPNPFGGCLISNDSKNAILMTGGVLIIGYIGLKLLSSKK